MADDENPARGEALPRAPEQDWIQLASTSYVSAADHKTELTTFTSRLKKILQLKLANYRKSMAAEARRQGKEGVAPKAPESAPREHVLMNQPPQGKPHEAPTAPERVHRVDRGASSKAELRERVIAKEAEVSRLTTYNNLLHQELQDLQEKIRSLNIPGDKLVSVFGLPPPQLSTNTQQPSVQRKGRRGKQDTESQDTLESLHHAATYGLLPSSVPRAGAGQKTAEGNQVRATVESGATSPTAATKVQQWMDGFAKRTEDINKLDTLIKRTENEIHFFDTEVAKAKPKGKEVMIAPLEDLRTTVVDAKNQKSVMTEELAQYQKTARSLEQVIRKEVSSLENHIKRKAKQADEAESKLKGILAEYTLWKASRRAAHLSSQTTTHHEKVTLSQTNMEDGELAEVAEGGVVQYHRYTQCRLELDKLPETLGFLTNVAMKEKKCVRIIKDIQASSQNLQDFDEQLEVDTRCADCGELVNEVVVFWPCGHSLCGKCINACLVPRSHVYRCSQCRIVTAELPVSNVALNRILGKMSFKKAGYTNLQEDMTNFLKTIAAIDESFLRETRTQYLGSALSVTQGDADVTIAGEIANTARRGWAPMGLRYFGEVRSQQPASNPLVSNPAADSD